jgi:hypothetical protein
MSVTSGTRLGLYEPESAIGAGGQAERAACTLGRCEHLEERCHEQ